jgi:hypothetical protein
MLDYEWLQITFKVMERKERRKQERYRKMKKKRQRQIENTERQDR